jgi:hypothetical protein
MFTPSIPQSDRPQARRAGCECGNRSCWANPALGIRGRPPAPKPLACSDSVAAPRAANAVIRARAAPSETLLPEQRE